MMGLGGNEWWCYLWRELGACAASSMETPWRLIKFGPVQPLIFRGSPAVGQCSAQTAAITAWLDWWRSKFKWTLTFHPGLLKSPPLTATRGLAYHSFQPMILLITLIMLIRLLLIIIVIGRRRILLLLSLLWFFVIYYYYYYYYYRSSGSSSSSSSSPSTLRNLWLPKCSGAIGSLYNLHLFHLQFYLISAYWTYLQVTQCAFISTSVQ